MQHLYWFSQHTAFGKKFLIFVWNKWSSQIRKTLQSERKLDLPDVSTTTSCIATAMVHFASNFTQQQISSLTLYNPLQLLSNKQNKKFPSNLLLGFLFSTLLLLLNNVPIPNLIKLNLNNEKRTFNAMEN